MIDWYAVFTTGLWLLGLSVLLAAASWIEYAGRAARVPPAQRWEHFRDTGWTGLGTLLFLVGMCLSAPSWLVAVLWAVPALLLAASLPRRYKTGSLNARRALAAHLASALAATEPEGEASSPLAVKTFARWLVRTELVWLGLMSPFFLFARPAFVVTFIALPVLWLARLLATGHFVPPTPLDVSILVLLVMVLVGLFATVDRAAGLERVANLLLGIALLYATVEFANSHRRRLLALAGYLLLGAGLMLLGLLGTGWTMANKLPLLGTVASGLPTMISLPGDTSGFNPNIVAGALIMVLPLQIAVAAWGWGRARSGGTSRFNAVLVRIALPILVVFMLLGLVLSQSRTAISGLLLGLALLAVLSARNSLRSRSARMNLLALALLAAVTLVAALYVGEQAIEHDVPVDASTIREGSGQSRLETWSSALNLIATFPLTGIGMGTFGELMPALFPAPSSTVSHAHNQFMQAALDFGLPGLVAFASTWLLAFAMAISAWRRARDGLWRAVAAGIAACLTASLVFAVTDSVITVARPGVFFWMLLGLLVVLWKEVGASAPTAAQSHAAEMGSVGYDSMYTEKTTQLVKETQP